MNPIQKLHISKVIGHRGACGYAPENTLISMYKAYELGIQWVEFDVMLTADDIAVVVHDTDLKRTTNGRGRVAHSTHHQIAGLDAGGWFAKEFAGERIPTFLGLLEYLQPLQMSINVEIKPTKGREEITAKKVIALLQQFWPERKKLLVSSFSSKALATARQMDSDIPLGFLADKWYKNWQHSLDKFNCVSLNINYKALTANRVATVKKTGRAVLAYTVNDPALAAKLFNWGVDSVFSDYPDRIIV